MQNSVKTSVSLSILSFSAAGIAVPCLPADCLPAPIPMSPNALLIIFVLMCGVAFWQLHNKTMRTALMVLLVAGFNLGDMRHANANASNCTCGSAPTLSVTKALGGNGRISNSSDQFTVQILESGTVVASGTTTGAGPVVDVDTGTTGQFTATAGKTYTIQEVKAGGTSDLGRYSASLTCTNSGTTDVSGISVPGASITPVDGDAIACTFTNTPAATLVLTQTTFGPVPTNAQPPYTVSYFGNNGWIANTLTNTALYVPVSSSPQTLSALNTATTLTATLPGDRFRVMSFNCTDTKASESGNPSGILVTNATTTVVIPSQYVRAGAALSCSLNMRRLTP